MDFAQPYYCAIAVIKIFAIIVSIFIFFSTTTAQTTTESTTNSASSTTEFPGECLQDEYGFADAIDKSLLFYEAQRSGDLPEEEMRITWRKDSALGDEGNDGEDLTGGYYDGMPYRRSHN